MFGPIERAPPPPPLRHLRRRRRRLIERRQVSAARAKHKLQITRNAHSYHYSRARSLTTPFGARRALRPRLQPQSQPQPRTGREAREGNCKRKRKRKHAHKQCLVCVATDAKLGRRSRRRSRAAFGAAKSRTDLFATQASSLPLRNSAPTYTWTSAQHSAASGAHFRRVLALPNGAPASRCCCCGGSGVAAQTRRRRCWRRVARAPPLALMSLAAVAADASAVATLPTRPLVLPMV